VQAFLRNIFKKNACPQKALKIKFGKHAIYHIKTTKVPSNKAIKGAKWLISDNKKFI